MNTQELTSLITRLEEEYGKATPKDWVAGEYENGGYWYGRIFFPGDPRNHLTNTRDCPMSKEDVAFIADAHNHLPTLLSALKHYMAVAEAGDRFAKAVKKSGRETYEHFEGSHWVEYDTDEIDEALAKYKKALDTPSN